MTDSNHSSPIEENQEKPRWVCPGCGNDFSPSTKIDRHLAFHCKGVKKCNSRERISKVNDLKREIQVSKGVEARSPCNCEWDDRCLNFCANIVDDINWDATMWLVSIPVKKQNVPYRKYVR